MKVSCTFARGVNAPALTRTSTSCPGCTCVSATACGSSNGNTAPAIVGSRTTTPNEFEPMLPARSSAVQSTTVRPYGNLDPLGGLHVVARAPSILSVAVGFVNDTTIVPVLAIFTSTMTSALLATPGGAVSPSSSTIETID